MANKNLFAPPEAHELNNLFAPPSNDELKTHNSNIGGQAQAALEGFGQTASAGYLPQLQALAEPIQTKILNAVTGNNVPLPDYIEARDENIARQRQQSQDFPKTVLASKAVGIAPAAIALPATSSIGTTAALGAAQGALYNPGDKPGEMDLLQPKERLQNLLLGGATAGTLQGVAKSGGSVADLLQQRAMGLTKFKPGVGTEALESGVYGTKNAMKSKLADLLAAKGQSLEDVVKNIKQPIDSAPIAEAIKQEAAQYTSPGGVTPEIAKPFLEKTLARVNDIESRGILPASEQLAIKRIVQKPGYNKFGEPLSKLESQLSQKEALQIGDAIEAAAAKEGNPGQVKALNQSLSKLLSAKTALEKPEPASNLGLLMDAAALTGASYYGHPEAGIASVAGRRAMLSPLVQSYVAKGLNSAPQSAANQSPAILEALLETSRKK